jgi:hypothetical protein
MYEKQYRFLDSRIEQIENMIYLCVSPKRICIELAKSCHGLTPIIYHHWKDETKYLDRIKFAYTASAEEHMNSAHEFLQEWLDPSIHPELDMQHVGIVREIGLFRSRMAEFLDRKKWGKKVEIVDERPQTKVISGRDLQTFLEGINNAKKEIDEEDFEESDLNEEKENVENEESNEDEGYIDYEEI